MKMLINESVIQAAAIEFKGNWAPLINAEDGFRATLCESIVNWVDQSGADYCKRSEIVRGLFPGFYY